MNCGKDHDRIRTGRLTLNRRSAQSGFTMVELVVGTFLASVISLAVFAVFIDSGEYFGQQLDQTQAQSSLRFAMEYIKGDLHDFGRLSIQNTDLRVRDPNYCGVGQYQGVELLDNDLGGDGYQPSEVLVRNNITPDRLRLLADVSDATPLRVSRFNGTTISLVHSLQQPTTEARRITGVGAELRFAEMFDNESLTRVTNVETGRYDLVPTNDAQLINGVGRITLAAPPCASLGCASGTCIVNPVHRLEYLVLSQEEAQEHTYLARRRLNLNNNSPIPDSELVIADYIVNFQLWGQYDTKGQAANAIGQPAINLISLVPDDPSMKDDRGNWAPQVDESQRMEMWSHRIRALNILISARAARVDPNLKRQFNFANFGPQERVTIDLLRSPSRGQAHVNSMIGAVDTANLYRGD